jgi:hypothetical protein
MSQEIKQEREQAREQEKEQERSPQPGVAAKAEIDQGQSFDIYHEYLRSQHPRLGEFPDYGLLLKPEVEARCRREAEVHGLDYEQLKQEFLLAHQVIPPLNPPGSQQETMALLKRKVIPLDALAQYFEGMISGAIIHQQRRQPAKA